MGLSLNNGRTVNAPGKNTRIEPMIVQFAAVATVLAWAVVVSTPQVAHAQAVTGTPSQTYNLPEPIYWKQTFFQIPYQWSSAAEPGAAQAVWLLVSKDQGASWQKISEARPNVTSFNYRAEGDGEYWFAVRTIDRQGRAWPAGDYQPELRVIVDTAIPRIEQLHAATRTNGEIELTWSGFDLNLDASSWKFDAQWDVHGAWQAVTLDRAAAVGADLPPRTDGYSSGRATWKMPTSRPPIAMRATVADRAGNSATYRSEVGPATSGTGIVTRLPAPEPGPLATNPPAVNPFASALASSQPQPSLPSPAVTKHGWLSGTEATFPAAQSQQPADQPWLAGATSHAPFRLSSSAVSTPGDNVTSYGTPAGANSLQVGKNDTNTASNDTGISAQYAVAGPAASRPDSSQMPNPAANPPFRPLQPYRQAPESVPPAAEQYDSPAKGDADSQRRITHSIGLPPTNAYASQRPGGVQPKLVGSRTFALEYDLEDAGRWGVSTVELWGTRDGGESWRLYRQDDDQRSPLVVTVDDEGLYGFRIVVQSAANSESLRPQPGDAPELWIAVDLQRPVAELTAIERGTGNLADHLILYWRAEDDNLDARPISLYYSSRPNGPWSTVAANLENTGQYAWRIERHVPERFYLRLEVSDTAGNLAAFHTREPIEFTLPAPNVRLNSAESITPTGTGAAASYR